MERSATLGRYAALVVWIVCSMVIRLDMLNVVVNIIYVYLLDGQVNNGSTHLSYRTKEQSSFQSVINDKKRLP